MHLAAGFQEIHQGVLLIDDNGDVVHFNNSAKEIFSHLSSLGGKSIKEIIPESKADDVLRTGNSSENNNIKIGDKAFIVIEKPVLENGKVTGVAVSLQSVEEIDKELEAIFNSSYDEIFVTDGEGKTIRVNKTCERLYGVKEEDIVGKNVIDLEKQGLFSPSITPRVLKEKRRITSVQMTNTGQKLIITSNPVFDEDGNIIRIVTNSRDITELSNLQERLKETEKLMENYRKELARLSKERLVTTKVIGKSPAMHHILDMAAKVASVDSTVLLEGESGVGKGVIASEIHRLSKRGKNPLITVNCGAIPENLMESELFGYEEGAFTGAKKGGKKGLIELANGGTAFFDEISELPLNLQVKLLDAIQERRFMRVGGNKYINVDIRIIVATNRNMQRLVKEKKFREDLFYRLNVVPLIIPPLRHRKDDITLLLDHFLDSYCAKYGFSKSITQETKDYLVSYSWPGNVRELENLVERLLVTTESYEIQPVHLPDYIFHSEGSSEKVFVLDVFPLKGATEEVERQLLKKAYAKYKNTYKMAEALGVNQSTVVRKMNRYEINKESGEKSSITVDMQGG